MARRHKNNETEEKSLYVEDSIDDSIYAAPEDEEEEETNPLDDELSIYQKPEEADYYEDEEEEDDEEDDDEEEVDEKKGLFGFLRRRRQEDEEEEEDDESELEDEDDDEEDEEPEKRRGFFGRRRRQEEEEIEDTEEDSEDSEDSEEESDEEYEDDEEEYETQERKFHVDKKAVAIAAAAAVVVIGGTVLIVRGLGGSSEGEAYVESVSKIAGLGSANGMSNRYTGEVEAQSSWSISLDSDLSVAECYVKVGDEVKKGDKLFKYDTEELQLSYERQELEIETIQNESTELTKQIATYQNDLKSATASEKIELQTQILTAQTQIKKNEFSLKTAKEELANIKEKISDAVVKSKMDGVVKTWNEKLGQSGSSSSDDSNSDSSGDDSTYMTILATGDFRVKGTINETNIYEISEGDPVIIRSRVSEDTWEGTISSIKTDATTDEGTSEDEYSYGDASGESTSTYNFYVTLNGDDGLMMGQHVFVELDNGQDEEQSGIWIPSAYLDIDGDDFYVWKDSNGKLKRSEVEVGEYNEMLDTYQIVSGIDEDDYIACDDDSLEQNMKTTKTESTTTENEISGDEEQIDEDTDEEYIDEEYIDEEYIDEEDLNEDGTVG